jgi:hypothetical protein
MADPLSAGIAAVVSGAGALFSYNKEAFVFEKTLRQAEAHQRQAMRVQEVALYREDIRDLFGVTVQKMDNYLIVNTLMLGFCISLLYSVDLPSSIPDWIHWMWILSMSGAMLFLLLSLWLCLHASITAQSLVVRLLTQWLRLPVPNSKEISKFAFDFYDYEKNTRNLLRIPALSTRSKKDPTPSIPEEEETMSGKGSGQAGNLAKGGDVFQGIEDLSSHQLQKTHLHLFRQIARSWRGYDAYARVCMIMGTNQLLQALGHLSVARMFMVNQQLVASLFVVITMHSLSLIHFKLNINPTRQQHTMMTVLLAVPPLTTYIAACLWFYNRPLAGDIVAIIAIFIHLVWICFVLTLAIEDEGGMPKNFTTVGLSSDIVGDDTFQDYIDDELEKIRLRSPVEDSAMPGDSQDRTEAMISNMEDDPIQKIKERMQQLLRQWRMVTGGTLVLTAEEEHARKRKIVNRFDRLCLYVKGLPVGDIPVGMEEEELRVLLDVKWNRLNSGDVFINIDTGEIRTPQPGEGLPGSPLQTLREETANPLKTMKQSKIEKFVYEVRRFKESLEDHESVAGDHHSSSSDDDHDVKSSQSSQPVKTKISNSTDTRSVSIKSVNGDNEDERASLLLEDDSKRTSKMLEKASTRPWSSYKQGSGLLIICWLIALIMSILLPLEISLKMPPEIAAIRGLEIPFVGGEGFKENGAHGAVHQAVRMIGRGGR